MLYNFKKWIKFQVMKMEWKTDNKHNKTYPGFYFNKKCVKIGSYTYGQINAHTSECENAFLLIGNYCSIASSSHFLLAGEHSLNCISTYPFKEKIIHSGIDTLSKGKIIIKDDVWIGENVTVLSGVEIGQGAVVAAGAVVTKNIPPYSIVAGVPAKVIRKRFSEQMIEELVKIDFSKLSTEMIMAYQKELYEPLLNVEQLGWLPLKEKLELGR